MEFKHAMRSKGLSFFGLKELLVSVLTIFSTTSAHAEIVSAQIRDNLKQGHLQQCKPTIEKQYRDYGATPDPEKVTRYCKCLGSLYFDYYTVEDYELTKETGQLPLRLRTKRPEFQEACAEEYL